ncbi:MAG: cation:proton antiporter [Kofleriaceae bacterium]
MTPPLLFLAGLAFVILFGFVGTLLFRATRVPDILILMAAGIVLGPYGLAWVTPDQLARVLPSFTTLALVMILFSGGLGMPLGDVLRGAPMATLFTVLVFVASVLATAEIVHHLLGWTLGEGAMLGAIMGGSSSATVLGLLRGAPVSERCKTLLSLESSITDVLCITVLVGLIDALTQGGTDVAGPVAHVGAQFGIGIVAGVVAGFAWGELARRARKLRLDFMITLAVVFALYVGVEAAGGSGAVATLVFGVVMASSRARSSLPIIVEVGAPLSPPATDAPAAEREPARATRELRTFHDELASLLRTLFFLVLGIRFPLEWPGVAVCAAIATMLFAWVAIRWLIGLPISWMSKFDRRDRFAVVHLFPRGMVAAVLATLPAQYKLADGTPLLSSARVDAFVLIAFLIIGLTTLWSSVAVVFGARIEAGPPRR